MKAVKVKLVQEIDGQFVVSETAIENIEPFMEVRGFEQIGKCGRFAPGSGRIEYREEMQGQPKYAGLCGPMYDGPGVVRYEDGPAHRSLSI